MNLKTKKEILDSLSDKTASNLIEEYVDNIGLELSNIINQDGDDITDGECIDSIVNYLRNLGIYVERKS